MKRWKPTAEELAAAMASLEAWERILRERMARIAVELGREPTPKPEAS